MKKVLLILLLLLFTPAVNAYEIEGNPDKIPSMGLNFNRLDLGGTYQATTAATRWNIEGGSKWKQDNFTLDVKWPVTSKLTFLIGGGLTEINFSSRDNTIIAIGGFLFDFNVPTMQTMNGYNFNIGLRLYLK